MERAGDGSLLGRAGIGRSEDVPDPLVSLMVLSSSMRKMRRPNLSILRGRLAGLGRRAFRSEMGAGRVRSRLGSSSLLSVAAEETTEWRLASVGALPVMERGVHCGVMERRSTRTNIDDGVGDMMFT